MDGEAVARTIELANEVPLLSLRQMRARVLESEIGFPVALALVAVMHGTISRADREAPTDVPGMIGIADSCENPLLKAAAAEACWHLRVGEQPYGFALTAIRGYRALASRPGWLLSDHAEVLAQALALAVDLNNRRDALEIAGELVVLLQEAVAKAPGRDSLALQRLHPQLVFNDAPEADDAVAEQQFHDAGLFALRALAQHRQSSILRGALAWDEIERCAVAALHEAGGDRSLRTALLEPLAALHGDPTTRASIVEGHLRAEAAWASTEVAGTRYVVLVEAERTARNAGLPDLALELQREIQGIDRADILSPIRTEVTLDGRMIDRVMDEFMGLVFAGEDWRVWAENLVTVSGCPIGSDGSTIEDAEESPTARPVKSAFPGLTVGPKSVPVRADVGSHAQPSRQSSQAEQGQARMFASVLLMPTITDFVRRLGDVPSEDQTAFFVSKGFDGVRAKHIVGALRLYRAGDFDGAAHKLLPRMEYLLRERASRHGSVIRPTDGMSRGGVDLLGSVLETLKGHIDEGWRRYLRFVLVNDRGLNLRNDTLHGVRSEATEQDAAIVVHAFLACCFLEDVVDEAPGGEGAAGSG